MSTGFRYICITQRCGWKGKGAGYALHLKEHPSHEIVIDQGHYTRKEDSDAK